MLALAVLVLVTIASLAWRRLAMNEGVGGDIGASAAAWTC
jgi:hypothetical protein